jgi:hypothetical protein
MTLVIRDQLVCPPTWFASYRDLTLYCAVFLKLDIVLESEEPDTYYRWIKPRGGMDFIMDIVRPGSESGLHLDIERRGPSGFKQEDHRKPGRWFCIGRPARGNHGEDPCRI